MFSAAWAFLSTLIGLRMESRQASFQAFHMGLLEMLPPETPYADPGFARACQLELRQVLNAAAKEAGFEAIPVQAMYDTVASVVVPHMAAVHYAGLQSYVTLGSLDKAAKWRYVLNAALSRTQSKGRFGPVLNDWGLLQRMVDSPEARGGSARGRELVAGVAPTAAPETPSAKFARMLWSPWVRVPADLCPPPSPLGCGGRPG